MARREMERLIDDGIRSAGPMLARMPVHHRLGVVPLAEPSVVVGVATAHIVADAFAACRFLIDYA